MTVKEGTVSPNGLTLTIENNSDINCLYGQFFLLEKKLDDKWYEVPVTIEGIMVLKTSATSWHPEISRNGKPIGSGCMEAWTRAGIA